MAVLAFSIAVLLGYLLGSLPTGFLIARARGIDIRSVGSGNIGATNVFRYLGWPAGILVLLVDAAKGFAAVWVGRWCLGQLDGSAGALTAEWIRIVAGVSAVLGHNYTCWLRFKGGKGIATSAGVLLSLVPMAFLVVLAVWAVVLLSTRYMSLASISGAAVLPVAVWFTTRSPALVGVTAVLAALAIYKHRSNIQRLLQGTEGRLGAKKAAAPGPDKISP